jgi:hypothetical protein
VAALSAAFPPVHQERIRSQPDLIDQLLGA